MKKISWILSGFVILFLLFSGKGDAIYFYDGDLFDAEPANQRWTLTHADTTNDRVHILVSSADARKYNLIDTSTVAAAVADDIYSFEFTIEVVDAVNHDFLDLRLITGTSSGSAGYYDRFFVGNTYLQLVYGTPDTGYSNYMTPNTPNWTTMLAKNTYRFERNGNAVKVYANGDLIYMGTGGNAPISSTQVYLIDNSTNKINAYWYSFKIDATYLYDGVLGDAEPGSQGWTMEHGDPTKGRVHILVSSADDRRYDVIDANAVANIVADDNYVFEFTIEVVDAINHDFLDLRLITGTSSGSAGYYDRFFIYDDLLQLVYGTPDTGYSLYMYPNTPNWTTMLAKNTYRFERVGNAVTIYANGDLIYKGTGGNDTITSTQVYLIDNTTNKIDVNWYGLRVGETTLNYGSSWIRNHPVHIAGTTDETPLDANKVTTYKDTWHATGVDVYTTAGAQITNWWNPSQVPFIKWITPGSEGPDGIFQESEVGIASGLTYRIGYHIGGEPLNQAELNEVLNTAAALKVYDPNAIVYAGINTDLSDALLHQYMMNSKIDLVLGHRYVSDNTAYLDLNRYRSFGLRYEKPYWRALRAFKQAPEDYWFTKSDFRFNGFSTLTYGCAGLYWFIYNMQNLHALVPQLFTMTETYDYANRKSPQFEDCAALNTELANVGNVIKKITSTDVRLRLGANASYGQPDGTYDWISGAGNDKYITNIIQLVNNDMDILIGFFVDTKGKIHFMLQNTLHDHGNTPGNTSGTIRVSFDFSSVTDPNFNKTRIMRLSRATAGLWEYVNLTADGGNLYHVDIVLEAGDADLFKYDIPLFSDGFESGGFTVGGWVNNGCVIQSTYKYSGTYASEFNSSDSLTKSLSTNGYENIQIQYARYTRNCETDDHFICEWYDGAVWNILEDLTGDSAWAVKTWNLPAGANNNANFQIRFRTSHNNPNDYAYLDDVKIIGTAQ